MPHIKPPPVLSHWLISTVTNNHILETSHRKWGHILGLILLPLTKKIRIWNTLPTLQIPRSFFFNHDALISMDFSSHAEKDWGLKTSKHDVMDWFFNQMRLSAWFDVPLDEKVAHLSAVWKMDMRVNVTLKPNITLHRVQIHLKATKRL